MVQNSFFCQCRFFFFEKVSREIEPAGIKTFGSRPPWSQGRKSDFDNTRRTYEPPRNIQCGPDPGLSRTTGPKTGAECGADLLNGIGGGRRVLHQLKRFGKFNQTLVVLILLYSFGRIGQDLTWIYPAEMNKAGASLRIFEIFEASYSSNSAQTTVRNSDI